MARSLSLAVGAASQLRSAGSVERWVCDSPNVATVTDEDLVSGRRGGMVTAVSRGRARVTAYGFGGECLLEVDVRVEGCPEVTLSVGETAQLSFSTGDPGWSCDNERVAAVGSEGLVRGISPGIAVLSRVGGRPDQSSLIKVAGTVELGVNETLSLAERFSVPVKSWRAGSSAVVVDSKGVVTAGDRPRTVQITAVLADDEVFSFDLRVCVSPVSSVTAEPEMPGLPVESPVERFPSASARARSVSSDSGELFDGQRREVESHLNAADVYSQQHNWAGAGAELTAALMAASGCDDLRGLVERRGAQVRESIAAGCAEACAGIVDLIRTKRYSEAFRAIDSVQVPRNSERVLDALRDLCGLVQSLDVGHGLCEEHAARLRSCLMNAWDTVLAAGMPAVLPGLAGIVAAYRLDGMAETIVRTVGGPTVNELSVRQSLEECLKDMGGEALEAVLAGFASMQKSDQSGNWLLGLLVSLDPGRHAPRIVSFYSRSDDVLRQRLAYWFSRLVLQSSSTLMDLLAGVYRRQPLDVSLVVAVKEELGADKLEKEAVRLASGGHKGAQVVLQRLFGYPKEAFK